MRKPLRIIYISTIIWTALGLISGLYYRELTRELEFTGDTQLSVSHTHFLALGTMIGLTLLLLEYVFRLSERRKTFTWLIAMWHAGVFITAAMQIFKGTLQVLGSEAATSKAIAGISGMGHIFLTVSFILLFLALGRRLKATAPAEETVAVAA